MKTAQQSTWSALFTASQILMQLVFVQMYSSTSKANKTKLAMVQVAFYAI